MQPSQKPEHNTEQAEQAPGQKIRLSGDDYAAQNPYHAAIARGYHIAQLTLFSILACFTILSMLIRSDDVTYENLFYLFQDIHAAFDSTDVTFTTLVYDADETQNFATYRGGLAVAGESGLTVFTATGRQTLTQSLRMTSPRLLTSSRYILVYEQGGEDFSVYNSFSRLHTGELQGQISCAALSDAGWIALAAQKEGGSAVISVFDKNFNLKTEFFKNAYATSLALNHDGDLLAVVLTEAVGGVYLTRVELYRPGTDTLLHAWEFTDLFPLSCSFADDDTLYLCATDRMLVLTRDGTTAVDMPFEMGIHRAYLCPDGYALLLADGTLSIYRADGTHLGSRADAADIRSVLVGRDTVHMMTENTLMTYHIESGQSKSTVYDFAVQQLLWYDEHELLLCSRSTARYLDISD